MCDNPAATRQDYLRQVGDLVADYGWVVQQVGRDRLRPPYAYTIGLAARGKPELIVTGMPARRSAQLLNDVAAHMLHAAELMPGERVPLVNGPLIEIVELEVPEAHLLIAGEFCDRPFRAHQLVHADDRGRWPWEVGYRGVRGGQPVLGTRAVTRPASAG